MTTGKQHLYLIGNPPVGELNGPGSSDSLVRNFIRDGYMSFVFWNHTTYGSKMCLHKARHETRFGNSGDHRTLQHRWIWCAWSLAILSAVAGCGCERGSQDVSESMDTVTLGSRLVAYVPDYRMGSLDIELASGVTDLIWFSLEVARDGGLNADRLNPSYLETLAAIKRIHNVRLLVAIGGWGRSDGFAGVVTRPDARGQLVTNLHSFCRAHGFDGVDFDWEYPVTELQRRAYADLLIETKRSLGRDNLLVTIAQNPSQDLDPRAYDVVDRVHLMSYDNAGEHATLEQMKKDVLVMLDQGIPREKLCIGIPFYGRQIAQPHAAMTYREIVNYYNPGPQTDRVAGIYFNGPATVRTKAKYAMEQNLAGVMVWELGQDAGGEASLMRVIRQVFCRSSPTETEIDH